MRITNIMVSYEHSLVLESFQAYVSNQNVVVGQCYIYILRFKQHATWRILHYILFVQSTQLGVHP